LEVGDANNIGEAVFYLNQFILLCFQRLGYFQLINRTTLGLSLLFIYGTGILWGTFLFRARTNVGPVGQCFMNIIFCPIDCILKCFSVCCRCCIRCICGGSKSEEREEYDNAKRFAKEVELEVTNNKQANHDDDNNDGNIESSSSSSTSSPTNGTTKRSSQQQDSNLRSSMEVFRHSHVKGITKKKKRNNTQDDNIISVEVGTNL